MAKLGPIIGTITVSIGKTALPVKAVEFEVPLSVTAQEVLTGDAVQFGMDIDRTELRKQLAKVARSLADRIEASFLAPGAVLLTCTECDAQIVSQSLATLRHEADGAHSLGVHAQLGHLSSVNAGTVESGAVIGWFGAGDDAVADAIAEEVKP